MKSADEYAEMAEDTLAVPRIATGHVALAQIYATLAGAAATREAARLTLDAQTSNLLSALEETNPDGCPGCGCVASIDHADGLVCEEYPGCSALMESPK